ncbi:nuclear transport factor 2 family protein [Nonomuraea dietziae]|uniref:nuclear transport factor 2 family protein n=1 Tax=Nonomuraea dietziae TaxID=65515 RepID=UPI003439EF44
MTSSPAGLGAIVLASLLLLTGCSSARESAGSATTPSAAASPQAVQGVGREAMAYVDAVNGGDLDALVASFAEDAQIVDVSRSIRGRAAIREWASNEVIGGRLTVLSIAQQRRDGQRLLVRWAPGGSDGWRAHYDFTWANGKIVKADLQYA